MKKYDKGSNILVDLNYQKFIKVMKLTIALLTLICLQVSAKTYSQDKITLKMNATGMKKVLFAIEKKTNFRFLFSEEIIKDQPPVSIDVVDAPIDEVMNRLLENSGISYKIINATLVVLRKGVTAAEITVSEVRVTGKVSSASGEALIGVSVKVKNSSVGTTTDGSGNFALTVPDDAVLEFSYVGFTTLEERVAGRNVINVTLQASTQVLDQVVVVGYGTQRKRDLTGSISSVKGDELAKLPSTNPISSLQGKVAGLTISNSGRAGSTPVVRIRGVNSPNSASPLYVVDGVLHDNIDFLNPADIETVDILRDPSSIAIYGLRGANGVIAITSKKAARGKSTINLVSSVGVQKVNDKIEMVDAAGFRKLYDAQLANLNAAPFDYTNYTANTNWQDLVLRSAIITSNSLSISNSGDKSTTLINLGYTNQEGVEIYDNYQRFLVRLREEIKFNNNIKVGGDITGYHWINKPPVGNLITNALWAAPIVPIQSDENTYYSMPSFQRAQVGNPIANVNRNRGTQLDKGYRLIGSLFAEIRFLKSFTWRSTVYTDLGFNFARSYSRLPI